VSGARGGGTRAGLLLAGALCLCACPEDQPKADDRLIEKLKAEQERLAKSGHAVTGPPTAPAPNPLAVAVEKNEAPRDLPLPGEVSASSGKDGAVVQLTGLTRSRTLKGEHMALTSDATFLAVKLELTPGHTATTFDLPAAALQPAGGEEIGVARDAQAVMGQRLARLALSNAQAITLYFDVPEGALKPGLKLKIPASPEPVMMGLVP
jgi:hypothetical protein